MLTLFALPKPFRGHFGVIQRNAVANWIRLRPQPEILLFGNEFGTAEVAREMGVRHVPEVACSEFGTPLISALFVKAQELASHKTVCYVNSDILLLGDFMKAVQQVSSWRDRFLMVGMRTEVDLDEPEIYLSADQEHRLRALLGQQNHPLYPGALDYFVFARGLLSDMPPFAIGRGKWDNWVLWKARSLKVPLVDATAVVLAVHQNHDYSDHPPGVQSIYQGQDGNWKQRLANREGIYEGEEGQRNLELATQDGMCTIEDATHVLTPDAVKWTCRRRILKASRPVRQVLGLRREAFSRMISRLGWR